jgi:NADH:ubiquinone oxidoreductase subunit 6 (subunit J)
MTALQVIFLLTGAAILGAALMVVLNRNMINSALWLVVALFGVAVLYVLLNAGFLAVVQVVVYIGAIAILFIFAVMLTRRTMIDSGSQHNKAWWAAALLALLVFAGLFFMLNSLSLGGAAPEIPAGIDPLVSLGNALVSPDAYVLPFEVASVLLLAALIGAVYVASDKKQ